MRTPSAKEGGWLALSRKRSFQIVCFSGIANCASTPVKLICRDLVTKHYREFDQKSSGGCCLRHRFWFLFPQPLVKQFQFRTSSGGGFSSLSELMPKQARTCLTDASEANPPGTGIFDRIQ